MIDQRVSANWGSAEAVDLPAGSGLAIIRDKKLKACREYRVLFGVPGWDDCLIDMNDDGRFDRVSFNNVGGSKDLDPPVPYRRATIEMKGQPGAGAHPSFRKEILFSGSNETVISLTYREYADDMARPAFTETLTLPLSKTFPQMIAAKGHVFELLSLDGMGLRYRLLR